MLFDRSFDHAFDDMLLRTDEENTTGIKAMKMAVIIKSYDVTNAPAKVTYCKRIV
jgi:hypothetical protein